jgi:hypothetical protein
MAASPQLSDIAAKAWTRSWRQHRFPRVLDGYRLAGLRTLRKAFPLTLFGRADEVIEIALACPSWEPYPRASCAAAANTSSLILLVREQWHETEHFVRTCLDGMDFFYGSEPRSVTI